MVAEIKRLSIRFALFKHDTKGLVVSWVPISESCCRMFLILFAHM
jgi:hypothetical protein